MSSTERIFLLTFHYLGLLALLLTSIVLMYPNSGNGFSLLLLLLLYQKHDKLWRGALDLGVTPIGGVDEGSKKDLVALTSN